MDIYTLYVRNGQSFVVPVMTPISFFIYFLVISHVACSIICSYKEFNVIQEKYLISVISKNYET
jgi:hypothetical protein